MFSTAALFVSQRGLRLAATALLLPALGLAALSAQAQPVFRIVSPDGRVMFTDLTGAAAGIPAPAAVAGSTGTANAPDPTANFPYLLRQAATQHPVTLYTSQNCMPCNRGRMMLVGRGIPFTEKTIATNADIEAFNRLGGGSQVPFLSVGAQAVSGYSESEWTRLLNNAGYPPNSQLPRTYQAPAPQALAPEPAATLANSTGIVQNPGASGEASDAAAAPDAPIAPPPTPGGIRF